MSNWFKTSLLMAVIVALFGAIGAALGGMHGMWLALVFGGAVNFFAYWSSDKLVLRMYDAREVDAASAPQLYGAVSELARNAGLPMPKVYLIEQPQPNAFATGRDPEHAAVAATTGIVQLLTPRELRGVLAHELTHVKHRDTLISTITATMAGAISMVAQFGLLFGSREDERPHPGVAVLMMIFAPLAAMLIQLAISRTREFEADRGGADISRDPQALASALEKIERYSNGIPLDPAEKHPETAQMMIINPLSGEGMAGWFRTHPATQERIARLLAMAR